MPVNADDAKARATGWWPDLALAVLIATVGLIPHFVFSREMGGLTYFKDAWDEDFYALQALWSWPTNVDRFLSAAVLRIVYVAVGFSVERTLILADFVLPVGAALAASYLVRTVATRTLTRAGLVLTLLLATDLLSLGSQAIWGNTLWLRTAFDNAAGLAGLPQPVSATTFLMMYRTPEPITSWAYAFVLLGCVLRQITRAPTAAISGPGRISPIVLAALLPFVYVFVGISLIVYLVGLGLLLLSGGWVRARIPLLSAAVGLACVGLAFAWTSGTVGAAATFPSRVPAVSPAVFASAILVLVSIAFRGRRLFDSSREMSALACVAVPLVVNLQQSITGIMVGPKLWENYSDYVFLTAGVTQMVPWDTPALSRGGAGLAIRAGVLALLTLLALGRARTYDLFHPTNLTTAVQARALAPVNVGSARVLLENRDDADQLMLRLGRPFPTVDSYHDVMVPGQRIHNMLDAGGPPSGRDGHQRQAFEQYARTGLEPARLATELTVDIVAGNSGRHLLWFFSALDATPGLSGNRAVRREAMRQQVNGIVDAYQAYLERTSQWRDPVIYLTPRSPLYVAFNPRFDHQLVARASVGTRTDGQAFAYLQTARRRPRPDAKEVVREWINGSGQPLRIVSAPSGAKLEADGAGLSAATAVGQLPTSTWTPAVSRGIRVEPQPDGLLVVTPPVRYAYTLISPLLSVPVAGRYAFVLTARLADGGLAFGALSADRSRWLAIEGPTARSADGDFLWVLELELGAGEQFVLVVANNHPIGDFPSTFVLGPVTAARYRQPS